MPMEKLWTLEFNIFLMMAVGFLIRKIRIVKNNINRRNTFIIFSIPYDRHSHFRLYFFFVKIQNVKYTFVLFLISCINI